MQTFTRTTTIAAPRKRVFSMLTDLDQAHRIMPDIVKVRLLTDGPFGHGTRWKETRRMKVLGFLPLRASAEIEVTEFDANAKLTTVADDGCNWASYTFVLRPNGRQKTDVELLGQFKCTGKHEGNEKMAKRMADWCEKADGDLLDRLKAHLEA